MKVLLTIGVPLIRPARKTLILFRGIRQGMSGKGWLMSHRRIHPWPKVNTEQQRLKMNLVMFSGLVAALPKCDWQHAIDFFLQILGFVSFCLCFF